MTHLYVRKYILSTVRGHNQHRLIQRNSELSCLFFKMILVKYIFLCKVHLSKAVYCAKQALLIISWNTMMHILLLLVLLFNNCLVFSDNQHFWKIGQIWCPEIIIEEHLKTVSQNSINKIVGNLYYKSNFQYLIVTKSY